MHPTLGMQAGEAHSAPHLSSASSSSPTIRLSVSIAEEWLPAWINPHTSRYVLGPYQLGTGP